MYVTTSIGIVMRGETHQTPDDLLRDADVALYRAKDTGRARFAVYDTSMGAAMIERVNIEADLRRAIERGELSLDYQPNISLDNGDIVGAEALIRWHHPRRGTVSPSQFLSIAEETGLINTIDAWVLEESCRQAREWQALRAAPLMVNVNISGRQLRRPELVGVLADILGRTGLNPALLRLEITEIAAMANVEITTETMQQLRALGVQVVIDDFGTGYSSLTHLKRFPIDTLKLDGSLVAGLGTGRDADTTAIARAVIGLAHSLGLSVIAEGVEQPDQAEDLRALGCAFGQGNYFSPPLSASAFTQLLLNVDIGVDLDTLPLTAD
jgi:EAL domain-containing protein (putative c-di-GMP-specific phosphodiesterase class I)